MRLERERTGWVFPDDVEPVAEVRPWAALLPTLDPTTMGWKERDLYLDPAHRPMLFDTGNGGATAWWDGRIVGALTQQVGECLLHDVGVGDRTEEVDVGPACPGRR